MNKITTVAKFLQKITLIKKLSNVQSEIEWELIGNIVDTGQIKVRRRVNYVTHKQNHNKNYTHTGILFESPTLN